MDDSNELNVSVLFQKSDSEKMDEKWNAGGLIVEIVAILVRRGRKRVQCEVKNEKWKSMIVASRNTQSGCCDSMFRGMIHEFQKISNS
jgi:hypothetical protein